MKPRPLLLAVILLALPAGAAEKPAEKIWQPAPEQIVATPTNHFVLAPDIANLADWKISFTARNGDTWVGGGNRIARLHRGLWNVFTSTNQAGPDQPVAFAESLDGSVWCATPQSVWQFDGRQWLSFQTGLSHVSGLLAASDGTLWVPTARGLFRFTHGAWLVNDISDGLPSNEILAMHEDEHGMVFAKTAAGWCRFVPEADTDPPVTQILSTAYDNANIPEDDAFTLSYRARDKFDQTAPTNLLYSWCLDQHEWSSFRPETEVAISGLGLGQHTFQVHAMDRNANVEFLPAEIQFNVVVPWYRELRLVSTLEIALVVSLFLGALALNRHRHLKHSYAEVEQLVAERTRQLELANRELLHSQKMNALGTLAAGIAHDFNNILSIIKGSAQIIEDNTGNPEKIRARTARIQTVVQQGAGVVEAMLGFGRNNDGSSPACDVNAVVAGTRRLLGDRFLHETEVDFKPAKNLPEISAPRDFVQQILLNFIFNADEAMSDGASNQAAGTAGEPPDCANRRRIELSTALVEKLPAEIYLPPAAAPKFILISVRDFGSGIAPEIRPRIFEPFFTTKNLSARRGTGLGLSMVYELAKKMGAGLAVDSTPGAGSSFTLILPAKTA